MMFNRNQPRWPAGSGKGGEWRNKNGIAPGATPLHRNQREGLIRAHQNSGVLSRGEMERAHEQDLMWRGYVDSQNRLTPGGRREIEENPSLRRNKVPNAVTEARQANAKTQLDQDAVDGVAEHFGTSKRAAADTVGRMSEDEIDALPKDVRRKANRISDMIYDPDTSRRRAIQW